MYTKYAVCVCILVLFQVAKGFHTTCDDGWLPYEGFCYLIGHYPLRFVEAEHYCRQHNSHAVEPMSKQENDFLKDQFRYLVPRCYWMGLTDEAVEDTWRWYSNNQIANFTDWFPGQPGHEGDQDCSVFWTAYDYKWGDIECNYNCIPVCRAQNIAAAMLTVLFLSALCAAANGFFNTFSHCSNGWIEYGNNCYFFHEQKMLFSEAEMFCLQHNSHLIDVQNAGENNFIRAQMKNLQTPETFWLGLADTDKEGEWRHTHHGQLMNFTDWYPGQPNVGDSEDCMVAPPYFDYHWGDYNCNDPCCFPICKKRFDDILQVVGVGKK